MSTLNGLHRRIDTIEKALDVPELGERGVLCLPIKDGIDGTHCDTGGHVIETAYSRMVFYPAGASQTEIDRLING